MLRDKTRIRKTSLAAFTLVELMIAIAIIGVLLGLALPAVQAIRESSRLTHCKNNLRQLTIGIANFESSNRQLPIGTLGFSDAFNFDLYGNWLEPNSEFFWKRSQHTSFAVQILPFVEQQNLFRNVDPVLLNRRQLLYESPGFLAGNFSWFGDTSNFVDVATTVVSFLHCPTDNMQASSEDSSLIVFGGAQPTYQRERDLDGFAWIGLTTGYLDELPLGVYDEAMKENFTLTNYLGCSGAHSGGTTDNIEMTRFQGMMGSRLPIRLRDVKDGLSNTVLLGESIGGIENMRRASSQSWAIGGLARMRGKIPWMLRIHPRQWHWRHLGNIQDSSAYGFGSKHSTTVNFAFGDGSVHSISRDIDWLVLYEIAGIADGSVIETLDPF